MRHPIKPAYWGIARGILGFALLAWVLSRVGFDLRQLTRNAEWVALFAGFPFFGAAIEASRLRLLLRSAHVELEFSRGYRMVLAAFAFNLCLPGSTGGDLLKAYWLGGQHAGKQVEIATVVFLDRCIGVLGFLLLGLGLAALEWQHVFASPLLTSLVAVALGVASVGVVAISIGPIFAPALAPPLARIPKVGPAAARAAHALGALREHGRALAQGTLLSLVGHIVLLGCYAVTAHAVLGSRPLTLNALLAFFGLLANMLPVTPGGMGIGEAAFAELFALFGSDGGATVAVVGRIGLIPAFATGLALYVSRAHRSTGRGPQRANPEARV